MTTSAALRVLADSKPRTTLSHRFLGLRDDALVRWEKCRSKVGGPAHFEFLYLLTRQVGATRVLETGVAFGFSSLAILAGLEENSTIHKPLLISNDLPYPRGVGRDCFAKAVPRELSSRVRWRVFRMADIDFFRFVVWRFDEFDIIHYDSDKRAVQRLRSYKFLWQVLRVGGFLVSDDVGDNRSFSDFCIEVGGNPIYLEFDGKYVGVLRKERQ